MIWAVSDCALDPALRRGLIAPGFESAPPAEIVGQVLGGDAVEAVEPLLEAAVVGVDVIDVQVRGFEGRLARRRHDMEGNFGLAREGGERLSAVADEVIVRGDDPGRAPRRSKRCRAARQDGVKGCAPSVAGDEDGNIVLIGARMPARFLRVCPTHAASRTGVL